MVWTPEPRATPGRPPSAKNHLVGKPSYFDQGISENQTSKNSQELNIAPSKHCALWKKKKSQKRRASRLTGSRSFFFIMKGNRGREDTEHQSESEKQVKDMLGERHCLVENLVVKGSAKEIPEEMVAACNSMGVLGQDCMVRPRTLPYQGLAVAFSSVTLKFSVLTSWQGLQ